MKTFKVEETARQINFEEAKAIAIRLGAVCCKNNFRRTKRVKFFDADGRMCAIFTFGKITLLHRVIGNKYHITDSKFNNPSMYSETINF